MSASDAKNDATGAAAAPKAMTISVAASDATAGAAAAEPAPAAGATAIISVGVATPIGAQPLPADDAAPAVVTATAATVATPAASDAPTVGVANGDIKTGAEADAASDSAAAPTSPNVRIATTQITMSLIASLQNDLKAAREEKAKAERLAAMSEAERAEEEERLARLGTGLTPETARLLKVGAGVGPREAVRIYRDVIWGILFAVFFLFVTGYGISGLVAIANLNFCDRVFPGDDSATAVGAPVTVYENCFTYLLRGQPDASALCTSYGLQQALTIVQLSDVGSNNGIVGGHGPQTMSLPAPPSPQLQARFETESVLSDSCLAYDASARAPSGACIVYGVSLLLPYDTANTMYSYCLYYITTAGQTKSDAINACARYTLTVIDPAAGEYWSSCIGNANQLSCVQSLLTPKVGASIAAAVSSACLSPSVAGAADAPATCIHYALNRLNSTNGDIYYTTCVSKIIYSAPGAILSCAQASGTPVPTAVTATQCLSYIITNSKPSPLCVRFALSLFVGDNSIASGAYANCVGPYISEQPNAAALCTSFALSLLDTRASQLYQQCSTNYQIVADPAANSTDTYETVSFIDCIMTDLVPLVGEARAVVARNSCLRSAVSGSGDAVTGCLSYGLQQLQNQTTIDISTLFQLCITPLMKGDPAAVFGCAQLANVPIPLPFNVTSGIGQCLIYIVRQSPLAIDKCLKYGLSLWVGSAAADAASSGCIQPIVTEADDAERQCALYALGQINSAAPNAYSQCLLNNAGDIDACVQEALNPIITPVVSSDVVQKCIRFVTAEDWDAARTGCMLYGLQQIANRFDPVPPVQAIYDGCIAYVIDGDSSSPQYCFRTALRYVLGDSGVIRVIITGLQKILPYSAEITALLDPACLQLVTTDPVNGVTCLVDRLIDAGANFARAGAHAAIRSGASSIGLSSLPHRPHGITLYEIEADRHRKLTGDAQPPLVVTTKASFNEQRAAYVADAHFYYSTTSSVRRLQREAMRAGAATEQQEAEDAAVTEAEAVKRVRFASRIQSRAANGAADSGVTTFGLVPPAADFAALGFPICRDVLFRGANFMSDYYNGLSDLVYSWRFEILKMCGWILFLGVGLAVSWMAIVSRYAAAIIKLAVGLSLIVLGAIVAVNLVFANYPGAIIVLLYMIFKALWYWWIRHLMMFAIAVLRTSLAALLDAPAPFFVAVAMFFVQSLWTIIFVGALFKFYSYSDDSSGGGWHDRLSEIFLVLTFFWTMEVLRNILSVTISGVISNWFYYVKSDTSKLIDNAKAIAFASTRDVLRKSMTGLSPGVIKPVKPAAGSATAAASPVEKKDAPAAGAIAIGATAAASPTNGSATPASPSTSTDSKAVDTPNASSKGVIIRTAAAPSPSAATATATATAVAVSASKEAADVHADDKPSDPTATTEVIQAGPTKASFIIAMTKSFGSICLGSLLVALAKVALWFFKKAKTTNNRMLRQCILAVVSCLIQFVEKFNMFAYVQVASLGKSYCQSALDTCRLMKEVGLEAIANDTIVTGVMGTGRMTGALCLLGLSGLLSRGWYGMPWSITAFMMVLGFTFGFAILEMATVVVEIATASLFVNFAIDPQVLYHNQPVLHAQLIKAWVERHNSIPEFMKSKEQKEKEAAEKARLDAEEAKKAEANGGVVVVIAEEEEKKTGLAGALQSGKKLFATVKTKITGAVSSGDQKTAPAADGSATGSSGGATVSAVKPESKSESKSESGLAHALQPVSNLFAAIKSLATGGGTGDQKKPETATATATATATSADAATASTAVAAAAATAAAGGGVEMAEIRVDVKSAEPAAASTATTTGAAAAAAPAATVVAATENSAAPATTATPAAAAAAAAVATSDSAVPTANTSASAASPSTSDAAPAAVSAPVAVAAAVAPELTIQPLATAAIAPAPAADRDAAALAAAIASTTTAATTAAVDAAITAAVVAVTSTEAAGGSVSTAAVGVIAAATSVAAVTATATAATGATATGADTASTAAPSSGQSSAESAPVPVAVAAPALTEAGSGAAVVDAVAGPSTGEATGVAATSIAAATSGADAKSAESKSGREVGAAVETPTPAAVVADAQPAAEVNADATPGAASTESSGVAAEASATPTADAQS